MKGFFYICFRISKFEQEASLSREWRLIQHFKVDTSTVNLFKLASGKQPGLGRIQGNVSYLEKLLEASDGSSKFSESRFLTLDTTTTVPFDRLMASNLTLHGDLKTVKYPKTYRFVS